MKYGLFLIAFIFSCAQAALSPVGGSITLGPVGSSPNANAATIDTGVLSLQPVDATHPGLLTTGSQTIAGAKTFTTALVADISGSAGSISGTLGISHGGTGQITQSAAFDALSPMSTSGDLIYGGVAGTGTRLPKDTDGKFLSLVSGLPAWQSVPAPSLSVVNKTTAYTATPSDDVINVDPAGATFAVTIYTPVGHSGKTLIIRNNVTLSGSASDFNFVNIVPAAGTINGDSSTTVATFGEVLTLVSNGTDWLIQTRYIPSNWIQYTPTSIGGAGTTSFAAIFWRRIGDSISVKGSFTTGTVTGSNASFTLPAGLTANASRMNPSDAAEFYGESIREFTGGNTKKRNKLMSFSTAGNTVYFTNDDYTTATNPASGQAASSIWSNSEVQVIELTNLPITHWNG